jgi:flotillin
MSYSDNNNDGLSFGKVAGFVAASAVIGTGALFATRFRVCSPEQMMIRTGLGIKDMMISKKGIQFPFQRYFMVNMAPTTFSFDLHNMSSEKVEFKLPVTFTTTPFHPDENLEEFKLFARRMNDVSPEEFRDTLGAMIEGEMRVHTATMTVEEMFSNREVFQERVVAKIAVDLEKLGIKILNANIKEMSDYDINNKFFEYRKQRAIESANYEAKKDVEEARKNRINYLNMVKSV